MKKEYDEIIVKKSSNLELSPFNDSEDFIVTEKEFGYRLVINKQTKIILNLIDNKSTIEEILVLYKEKKKNTKINTSDLYYLLYKKLSTYGIIINDKITINKKRIAPYLSLSFTLIKKNNFNFLISFLYPIFIFKYFYKIFFSLLIILLICVYLNKTKIFFHFQNLDLKNWLFIIVSSGVILFFHEIGHATACKKLGAEPGDIGFGFYLLSPVMFADVSDIWKLNIRERVFVNFSGLYVEIIIAFLLLVLYFIFDNITLITISSLVILSVFINLNPFLRYDGYWILSDLTKTPNLRIVSNLKLNQFIKKVRGKSSVNITKKDVFLILYGLISTIFVFVFVAVILIKDPQNILQFPYNFYIYCKSVIDGRPFDIFDLSQFILPFLFYYLSVKIGFSILYKKLNKIKMDINTSDN